MKKIILALLFLSLPINYLSAATISALVDRNPVSMDETFQLFFEASESPDDDPDFSPLENDFEIINQSQSSNISIVNGKYSKKIKWTLLVMARRAGTLTIPVIKFGDDSSSSIRLSVKAAGQKKSSSGKDVFMEMEIQPEKAWVQSQIIVTLRFFSAFNLAAFSDFPELKTRGVDVVIEKLGKNKQFQTRRGKRQYLVIETKLAIFPQESGELAILPLLVEARIARRSNSMFDPFQRSGQIRRARTQVKKINIQPAPASHKAKHWLPSKEVQLADEWPEDISTYKAGEPITRTITIMADGLTSAQLPEFKIAPINNVKQYPDKPSLQNIKQDTGIVGMRKEKIAYIPSRAGSYTFPAIKINWWNTQTGKQQTARIAAKTIKVLASETNPSPAITLDTNKPQAEKNQPASTELQLGSNMGLWLSLFLAIGWLATLLLWWRHHHRGQALPTKSNMAEPTLSVTKALKNLKQACQSNQPQACKDALLEWGKAAFPEISPNSLGELALLLNDSLTREINQLEASLYSRADTSWKADQLYKLITDWRNSRPPKKTQGSTNSLEPLRK